MHSIRCGIFHIALTAIAIQIGVVALGMVPACWEPAHTHAGTAAPDCPMHHQAEPQPAGHAHHAAHHDHAGMAGHASPTDERISCRCAGDLLGVYSGPHAIVTPPASFRPPVAATFVATAAESQPVSRLTPPTAPPPRSAL